MDTGQLLGAGARWCRPSRGIERVNGALDILDHAAPRLGAGMKIGFDCTRKIAGEEVDGVPACGGQLDCSPSAEACGALLRLSLIHN